MDRSFALAAVVFVALGAAGTALIALGGTLAADAAAVRLAGTALLAGSLAAFLGEAFRTARERR